MTTSNKKFNFTHGKTAQAAVIYVNLGTPQAPTAAALRPYLKQFLSDTRVVEIPKFIWWFILNGIIVPFRSKKSAAKYAAIWTKSGSPLMTHTLDQAKQLGEQLAQRDIHVSVIAAMRYGQPSIDAALQTLQEAGCNQVLIVPAYPQYSGTTTASNFDAVVDFYKRARNVPELRFIKHYHDHPAYINALKNSVLKQWQEHGQGHLVMSFHGVPKRTLMLGDPYHCECYKTGRLLAQALGLSPEQYTVTFQSRFGKAEWLQPYTQPTIEGLAKQGVKRVDVICPGFTSDCLETLEEINMEVRSAFMLNGGQEFHYIPCLNSEPSWIAALTDITATHLQGWQTSSADLVIRQQQAIGSAERAKKVGAEQ